MEMWNKILAIKQQILIVTISQFTTKRKIDCWVIAIKQQKSQSSLNYNHKTHVLGFTFHSDDWQI